MEIIPNGATPFTQSFVTEMARNMNDTQFDGKPTPDDTYSFDGYKVAGFEKHFPSDKRYIKPEDKNRAFAMILKNEP